MPHIKLSLFLRQRPATARLRRRRQRKLRPIRPSRKMELWYRAELRKIVRLLKESARRNLLPAMQQIARFRGDVLPPSLAVPFATMQQEFKGIDRTAARLAQMAAQRNLEQVDERLTDAIKNSVGVDISAALTQDGPIRQAMEDAVKANIDLITSIPEQYLARLKKGVEENFLGGSRASLAEQLYPELRRELGARYADNPPAYFEDMTPEEILDQVDQIAENRVRLIARDQTSKMNASFNQARQTSVGIEKYEWQTAGDERVRESHAELDGQVFSWDDPPEVDGEPANPGEPVNCRCVAIPFFDLDSEEE